jgi:hypothetical protein
MRPSRAVVVGVAAGALCIIGVAIARSSGSERHAGTEHAAAARSMQAFKVLREPSGGVGRADPAEIEKIRRAMGESAIHFDDRTARLARNSDGQRITLLAGDSDICMAVRESTGVGSLSCQLVSRAGDANTPLLQRQIIAPGRVRLTALLVDGATNARVEVDGRPGPAVAIKGNIAAVVTDGDPTALLYSTTEGTPVRVPFAARLLE